jgi:LuxR family maltose regulon positive regulatory protein
VSLAAGDPVLAARLLIDDWTAGRVLSREDDRRWPVALVLPECTGPDAAVLRAAAALGVDAAPAGADLALAAAATADTSARPALRISAAVVCAAAGDRGAPGVQAAAETAPKLLAELPEEHRGRRELAAVLATAEAAALLRTDAADATLAEALRAAVASSRRAGAGRPLARCLGALALLEALQGRLRTAADLLAGHEALCAEWRLPPATQTPAAAIAAAWVAAERGEQADARRGWPGCSSAGRTPTPR